MHGSLLFWVAPTIVLSKRVTDSRPSIRPLPSLDIVCSDKQNVYLRPLSTVVRLRGDLRHGNARHNCDYIK
ncbi:uncharacterized protein BDW70DRAFT_95889 [Aspergillus foveolatus]|uniref:uncharacterized protein n=1 Tax=Aspergillus foveolatus TaxID=210207 RepID=UPI003CCD6810